MNRRNMARREEVFAVHQAGDGQPTLGACGARQIEALAAVLEVAHPYQKLQAQPAVERDKDKLRGVPHALGAVRGATARKDLPFLLEIGRWYSLRRHRMGPS